MSVKLDSVTAPVILELIQQHLSKTEQRWLNKQLTKMLEKPALSLEEKRRLIDESCGGWAGDESIKAVFEEIEAERNLERSIRRIIWNHHLRNTNSNGTT